MSDVFGRMLGSYLAWQTSRQFVRVMLDASPTPPEAALLEGARNNRNWFDEEFSTSEKYRVVKQYRPRRARRMKHCEWSLESYPIEDLGTVLPETGDLPPSELTGPFTDVVAYVREQIEAVDSDSYSVQYVENLEAVLNLIAEFPPIVVEPGWVQRSAKVMKRHHGGSWDVRAMPGYVEDGNHRALATAIHTDSSEVTCFVGRHRWFRW
ncbi:hypothetical protein [Halapricum hydrolyticum]|uniref:Uncharacterized protein n=1 Tax=Halapricum hydrolyticum TaxID=2979991 RepID=A0AAE3IBT4_9EURY|nr:hypothetical protein [Halapricum hydrolyticum]MCU4718206.1 hypothetical protein [Halapricum hydrolyticum]MCU4726353.1 hypothetical protein [Halapricum hydrolyticum]